VARAIDWAIDHGAHVITMSLGGGAGVEGGGR
jgi:subtilisin family serine protease